MQFSNKKCDVEPYFCCPSFLCTRVISYCTRVVSCCTRVVSCCTRVVSCCTRVVLCCVVSCCVVLSRVVLVLCRVVSCCTRVVSCCYSCSFLDQIQNVTALAILERLELKFFSCRPTMVTDNTFYFPKVHRSTLRIYCIFQMFMTSICEKKKLPQKYGLFIHFSAVHYLHKKLHLRCSTPF